VAARRSADENLDHDSPLAELFEDQLAAADIVVLNKSDQLDPESRARAEQIVTAELRRSVKIVPAIYGAIDAKILLGLGAAAEDDLAARPSHHDAEGGEHDHDDFESFHVELPELASPQPLLDRLSAAVATHDILRVKGFLAVADKEMRLVLQGVGGRLQHYYDRAWAPGEARASRLVVIGLKGLDRAAIAAKLAGQLR
jgi:cobalamin biosynthesis protein CobW